MNTSLDSYSTESDIFYVEQTSTEGSPIRNNTPAILNWTEISEVFERSYHNLLCCLPGTTHCDAGLWLEWPYNALWVWQSTTDCSAKPQWPQSAAQPLQCTGNDGRNPSGWRTLQPPIAGAFHSIPNLNASDERQYYWRVGHHVYYYRRQHILFVWKWAQKSLPRYFVERHLRLQRAKKCVCRLEPFFYSTASTTTEEKTKHGDVFSSEGRSVAAHLRGMQPTLTTSKAIQCLEETQTLIELLIKLYYIF